MWGVRYIGAESLPQLQHENFEPTTIKLIKKSRGIRRDRVHRLLGSVVRDATVDGRPCVYICRVALKFTCRQTPCPQR